MKPIQLGPIRADGIATHSVRAEQIACGGSTSDIFSTTKERDTAHSHNEHRAASQRPSISQYARLSRLLERESALPTRTHVEEHQVSQSDDLNQEMQSSQSPYVKSVEIVVPITLRVAIEVQTVASPQPHSSSYSSEQTE